MSDGYEKSPETGFRRTPRVDREEQGDLLAEAVTGFLSPDKDGGVSFPGREEENSAEERDPVAEIEPVEGVKLDSGGDPDSPAGLIPDSPWERKMAWAKEQAAEGRLGEARGLYRELVEEDPTNVRALNNLGILLDEMGDSEGAVAQLRAAKRIDPHNQEVLGNLSAALGAMGRYADAEEELRLALRLDPSNLEIRANLGLLLFRRGLYDQAAAELAVVCAGRPDDGLPLFYRGEALNRLGRVEEAIKALERVTELIPGNPRAYYTLGVLFDKKNSPDRAAAMYRKARELADS